jgi:type III pantothenate kinase
MILVVDAGNSRIKWAFYEYGEWLAQGAVSHQDLVRLGEAWKPYGAPTAIAVSNVAGEKIRSALSLLFARFRVPPIWVAAGLQQCGVWNHYEQPNQLGSDRWAALIAARHIHPGPALVVNAGTAVTIDALSAKGEFLGGLILPGVRLMLEVLSQKTAGLRVDHGEFKAFPANTRDAVYSGAIHAVLGGIGRMRQAMVDEDRGEPLTLLSGGAAPLLEPHVAPPARAVENLVLHGLARIAEA